MRTENQHWNQIRLYVEVVEVGEPVTGLNPRAQLKRISDGLNYVEFNPPGSRWQAVGDVIELNPVAGCDGLYEFVLPQVDIDFVEQLEGYIVCFQNGDIDGDAELPLFTEHCRIITDFTGEDLFRVLALRQANMRQTNLTFHSSGQPETGTVKIYRTPADATGDINVAGEYAFTATYDGSGQLLSYVSTRVS